MKIAATTNLYPVLNQNQPNVSSFRQQGTSQKALKITPPPYAARSNSAARATYNQSGQTTLTTRGHFVDQYI